MVEPPAKESATEEDTAEKSGKAKGLSIRRFCNRCEALDYAVALLHRMEPFSS